MARAPKISFVELKPSVAGTAVVLVDENLSLGRVAKSALAPAGQLLSRAAKSEGFKGKLGKTLDLIAPAELSADRLIVLGLGKLKELKPTEWIKLGGKTMAKVPASAKKVTVLLELPEGTVSATAAAEFALGQEYAGMFSNNDKLCEHLTAAGQETGERVWRMPLGPEYDKQIDSKFADMKNTGGRNGGAITAAQLLQRFVGDTPWAHLDVAGTAMAVQPSDYNTSWGPGWGVRLLNRWIENHHED